MVVSREVSEKKRPTYWYVGRFLRNGLSIVPRVIFSELWGLLVESISLTRWAYPKTRRTIVGSFSDIVGGVC